MLRQFRDVFFLDEMEVDSRLRCDQFPIAPISCDQVINGGAVSFVGAQTVVVFSRVPRNIFDAVGTSREALIADEDWGTMVSAP
jgi:hypothetical protein